MSTPSTPLTPDMSTEQLLARLQEMEKRNAQLELDKKALAQKAAAKLTIKLGNKGTISLYGLQRFPVSLYAEQWEKVFEAVPAIKEFISKNREAIEERVKNPLISDAD